MYDEKALESKQLERWDEICGDQYSRQNGVKANRRAIVSCPIRNNWYHLQVSTHILQEKWLQVWTLRRIWKSHTFLQLTCKEHHGWEHKKTGHEKFEPVVYILFQKQYMNSTSFEMTLYTVITAAFGTAQRPSNVSLSIGIVSEQHRTS